MSLDVNTVGGNVGAQSYQAESCAGKQYRLGCDISTPTFLPKNQQQQVKAISDLFNMVLQMLQRLMSMLFPNQETAATDSTDSSSTIGNSNGTSSSSGTESSSDTSEAAAPTDTGTGSSSSSGASSSTDAGSDSSFGTSGSSAANQTTTLPVVQDTLQAAKDDAGVISILTNDGYTVKCEGKDQAWTLTGPDGKTTRIWGDPHVNESDGDSWDFGDRTSFTFGKNKVTVEVVPAGNGQYFTSKLHVYNGDERVSIGGIDQNKPEILVDANDALVHDASLSDGSVLSRAVNEKGESYTDVLTKEEKAHPSD